ncbi:protein-disulfide reductase DsbD family protein [Ehrlichia canis]|uniref:Cytochrome c biogenesis protein, transmembrane region n=1 Tax=Ehrlichia canis (strain Jake) TaxID=269484 RepID=A0ACA6AXE4_EHRCJ|nr:thioredoxin family protein [Ehrlichia canis]AAZ68891.1 Cytochrome c biogenesis protein, transmembrane region [Ehrlichia canis str. Jake]AUO55097.1 thiol:disulfide interchange protein [Ehrlichia canis]UKC53202.1 thiol:disulfide interchange protein [Ehrlichia canis]UKC54139.1 thiol:disulfide interchange protein [Ehrlichia canis]UKC55075.1 thiol:disulfide interchange protein [Ehrlichia canis]
MFFSVNLDLIYILISALLGGVILNCMPCVFPVLSLKIMSLIKSAKYKKKISVKGEGLSYTLGVMTSMFVLSSVLLILRHFGHLVSWGYQMQSPMLITLLMYVMFLMGLSFSGFYDFPFIFPNLNGVNTKKEGLIGSFFVGVLSTFIATPCTVPFMVSAITVALSQPSVYSLLIFQVLGFGMALPYLLLSFFPGLLKILPKPGKWMEVLQRFLAFPLYFSAAWLLCILVKQKGTEILFAVLSCAILFVMGIWIMKLVKSWKPVSKFVIFLCLLLLAISPLYFKSVKEFVMQNREPKRIATMEFSQAKLDQLLKEKKTVLLSVGADWCLTCKVNEQVFQLSTVQALFAKKNVYYMKGDLTTKNPEVTAYINQLDKNSIPLYVLYVGGVKVKVLPQVLSEKTVIDIIKQYVE